MPKLTIYRSGSILKHVGSSIDDTMYYGGLMNMNKITSKFETAEYIDFSEKDYIIHNGHTFELKDVPEHTETHKHDFSAEFLGIEYRLFDWLMLSFEGRTTWSFFGTASELLALVMTICNTYDPGWTISEVEETTPLLVEFNEDSCRSAVTKIAEAFKLEYQFNNKALKMKKTIGNFNHDLNFGYGKGKGLYSLTKKPIENANWGTVFYGFGSSENLPANYKDGLNELSVAPVTNFNYTDRIKQRVIKFPEIRPEYTGTVSATTETSVSDTGLDFDLNSLIVDGSAKIIFISGDLNGQIFEIQSYKSSTKTINFKPNKDESGNQWPNEIINASVGDKFKLVGIAMPDSYVANAEAILTTALTEYASLNGSPKFAFSLNIAPAYLYRLGYTTPISPGDKIGAKYQGTNLVLRVTEINYPIFLPQRISSTISDEIQYSLTTQVKKDIVTQKVQVEQIKRDSIRLQSINSIRRRELEDATFDVDGDYRPDKIKAGSISAQKLESGARSQDFALSSLFKPNFNADPNAVHWTAGTLTHFSIADTVKVWNIVSGDRDNLLPGTLYYVYAKCLRTSTSGEIVLDTTQRRVADDPTYFYFLIGVAHTVIDGVRAISLTYGYTEINGKFITTGRIVSADGLTWFDLDAGEIAGVIKFRASDGGMYNVAAIDDAFGGLPTSGVTIVDAGKIKTDFLDAVTIKSTIVQTTDLSASRIVTGTLDASVVNVIKINASNITSGTINTNRLDASTIKTNIVQTTDLNANRIVTGTLDGDYVNVVNIDASNISTGILNADYVDVTNLKAGNITSGTLNTARLDAGTVKSSIVQTTDLSATKIVTGTLNASLVNVVNLSASSINTGTLDASAVNVVNINASNITSGTIDASNVTIVNLTASNVSTNAGSGQRIVISDVTNDFRFYDPSGINVMGMVYNSGGSGAEIYVGTNSIREVSGFSSDLSFSCTSGSNSSFLSPNLISTTGTYRAYIGAVNYDGITHDFNFGAGNTIKVVGGLIVGRTGF